MFSFKFPYTNFHELNLDWILETTKSNTDRIAANELKIKLIGGDDPLNSLHPVGSIYISDSKTSPASLFGGTWEQLKDRFLLGAGDTYVAGSAGGEAAHKLTVDEIAKHSHEIGLTEYSSGTTVEAWNLTLKESAYATYPNETKRYAAPTNKSGGGVAHNNMPPYLAVYMWKRVS